MSAFTDQILSEKLAKLNSTQQSIETLSHWCIFHRKKAAQVVQRWAKNFRGAQANQKLAFLYLANDIIQNSRRKGPEFVNEFWKVLPGAVNDAVNSKDSSVRTAIDRLMSIWDERKVFGQRDINDLRKGPHAPGATETQPSKKSIYDGANAAATKPAAAATKPAAAASVLSNMKQQVQAVSPLESIGAAYAAIQDSASTEEAALRNCKTAVVDIQSLEHTAFIRAAAGPAAVALVAAELQQNQSNLAKWTSELDVYERKRAKLVNLLKEALSTQESKLERVRSQVQVAQSQAEQAVSIRHKLLTGGNLSVPGTPQAVNERIGNESNGRGPGGTEGAPPTDPRQRAPIAAPISNPESQPLAAPGFAPAGLPAGLNGMPAGTAVAPAGVPTSSIPEVKVEASGGGANPVEAAVSSGDTLTDQERQKQNAALLAARLTSSAASAEIMKSVLQAFAANNQVAQMQTLKQDNHAEKRQKTEIGPTLPARPPFQQESLAPSSNFPTGHPNSMPFPSPNQNHTPHAHPMPPSSTPPMPYYPHPNNPHSNAPPLPITGHGSYYPPPTSPPLPSHSMGQRTNFGPAPPPPGPSPYPQGSHQAPYMSGRGPPSAYLPQYNANAGPAI